MEPKSAMIFAAGFGTRMRDLTKDRPKPLVKVADETLLDRTLSLVDAALVERVVVNTHYKGEMIAAHLAGRPDITVINEAPDILDTGGGLKNALPQLGAGPVFTMNSDAVWTGQNPLVTLLEHWRPEEMDALLIMVPKENARLHKGAGDFFLNPSLQLFPRGERDEAPFVFGGIQIIKTDRLAEVDAEAFSMWGLWDRMLAEGRMCGAVHTGGWVDVGSPEGVSAAEELLAEAQ